MEKQTINIKADTILHLQPYFNQVISSNLVSAFILAKQVHPEKTEKEIVDFVMNLFTTVLKVFNEIPTKIYPSKKSEEEESKK